MSKLVKKIEPINLKEEYKGDTLDEIYHQESEKAYQQYLQTKEVEFKNYTERRNK